MIDLCGIRDIFILQGEGKPSEEKSLDALFFFLCRFADSKIRFFFFFLYRNRKLVKRKPAHPRASTTSIRLMIVEKIMFSTCSTLLLSENYKYSLYLNAYFVFFLLLFTVFLAVK